LPVLFKKKRKENSFFFSLGRVHSMVYHHSMKLEVQVPRPGHQQRPIGWTNETE
jgi:hypothetical protein